MSIFERSVTCSFFQELYSHIDKNSGEKFEDMFLVKIASKGTSLTENRWNCLNPSTHLRLDYTVLKKYSHIGLKQNLEIDNLLHHYQTA